MKRTAVFILGLGIAAWAGAKSYTVTLYDPAMAGATELRPGDYQLNVQNDKAVLRMGKVTAENPVKVETSDVKYANTSVLLERGNGKAHIKEIHLGGTNTKVVFTETQP